MRFEKIPRSGDLGVNVAKPFPSRHQHPQTDKKCGFIHLDIVGAGAVVPLAGVGDGQLDPVILPGGLHDPDTLGVGRVHGWVVRARDGRRDARGQVVVIAAL